MSAKRAGAPARESSLCEQAAVAGAEAPATARVPVAVSDPAVAAVPAAGGDPAAPAAGDGAAAGEEEGALAGDLEELSARTAERDEYLALAQHTQADFDNYRKRVARDASAALARGTANLARELLPALDNLDRALAAVAGESGQLVEGMRLVRSELHGALARAGIEAFEPAGETFDPGLHEAVAQQPVDGAAPGTIVEVYQSGYRLSGDGALIRPARVLVAG
ncbi:MAG: nucleotide exchange factor GrpE [Solirubrobacteraceae bacterium]